MSKLCELKDLPSFFSSLPKSGMLLNGTIYQLTELVTPMYGKDYGWLPTLNASDHKGVQRFRYKGSAQSRGVRMAEGLRTGSEDGTLLDPCFAEAVMGYKITWTELQPSETLSSQTLLKQLGEQS